MRGCSYFLEVWKGKRLKEISISKRSLGIAVVIGLVLAIGILAIDHWPLHGGQASTVESTEDIKASRAAVSAVEKIFQIDTTKSKDDWLKNVCAVSTSAGCKLFSAGAEGMWANFAQAKTVVSAEVQPLQKVANHDSEQVWQVAVSLTSPLPGSNKTEDMAYVALVKTGEQWLFDRFLLQPEIDALLARPTTATPAIGQGAK